MGYIDISNQKFGYLTAIKKAEPRKAKGGASVSLWECRCDCGNETIVNSYKLRKGLITSCGCMRYNTVSNKKHEKLEGKRFGRLTVVRFLQIDERENRNRQWLCKCDCGNYCQISGDKLNSGHTNSCGCYAVDRVKQTCQKYKYSDKRLYCIWRQMINRCHNEKDIRYKSYGEKGITVVDEWKNNYDTFAKWSFENGYAKNLTIDRINNYKGYSPDNCRWITNKEQQNNKKHHKYVEYKGEIYTVAQLADLLEMPYNYLYWRVSQDQTIEYILDNYHAKN